MPGAKMMYGCVSDGWVAGKGCSLVGSIQCVEKMPPPATTRRCTAVCVSFSGLVSVPGKASVDSGVSAYSEPLVIDLGNLESRL